MDGISQDPYFLDFVMSVFPRLIPRQSHESAKGHKACKWQRQDSTRLSGSLCGLFVSGLYDSYLEIFSVEMGPSYFPEFSLPVPAAES